MARSGHIYSYDAGQNVTFPRNVTFLGNVKVGKTSSDAGTDKTRIYFGDGDYV
jgi:hypothetical protein